MKKKVLALGLSFALTVATAATIYAETQNTGEFIYQDIKASGQLSVDWNVFDPDYAKAWTKFVSTSNSGYRVAVRLELYNQPWSSNPEGVRYAHSTSWAEVNMQDRGVWAF